MPTLRRVVRLAAFVAASFVALAVTAYLVVNVGGALAAHGKRAALSDEITRRVAEELPASRQRAEAVAGRIPPEPDHSWVAQRCSFETNDSGWIVQDHREVCALESVHAWQVESEAEARRLIEGELQANEPHFTSGPCVRYPLSGQLGQQNPFAQSRLDVAWAGPTTTGSRWCLPDATAYQPRRGVVGEVPELDPTHGWLVVVQTDELVDEVIGCTHWSVIFCDNPFGDEPAWGDSPS